MPRTPECDWLLAPRDDVRIPATVFGAEFEGAGEEKNGLETERHTAAHWQVTVLVSDRSHTKNASVTWPGQASGHDTYIYIYSAYVRAYA